MKIPPLLRLIAEVVSVRRLLLNRFTIIIIVTLVAAVALQGFVAANNDGQFTGQVVDSEGEPVEDATVAFTPQTLAGVPETERTTTDENGEFAFEDPSVLEFRIQAQHEELGRSEGQHHHLYFLGQNTEVTIVIDG